MSLVQEHSYGGRALAQAGGDGGASRGGRPAHVGTYSVEAAAGQGKRAETRTCFNCGVRGDIRNECPFVELCSYCRQPQHAHGGCPRQDPGLERVQRAHEDTPKRRGHDAGVAAGAAAVDQKPELAHEE